jgi:predicted flavoprotein YhiN
LVRELVQPAHYVDPASLAAAIKAVAVAVLSTRPLDEAISSAGGVALDALDSSLMLERLPGIFCAGEMLDWEAPTGGYLLTACFASGRIAGEGAARRARDVAARRVDSSRPGS